MGRKVAGKYFVHQRLGKGGMGLVYKATDVVLDRPVALKMLDRALLSDSGMVQRFHREARAASRLHHSNCIVILDFGQLEDGQLYIAMEFLPGRSLARLVAEEFPIPQARVVRIGAQILAALAEAHAAGIIHRDLKLSNVMVESRRDEPDFVKVLDFGIAKLMTGEGRSELTTAGMICGTPGYMSPEQARGEELDARSDLYSVGIILYELLTGRLPFESETPMAMAVKHMTETPIAPSLRRPDLGITPELDQLVMRALSKERELRYPSAEEMRAALLLAPTTLDPTRATPRPATDPSTVVMPPLTTPRPAAPERSTPRPDPGSAPRPSTPPSSPEGGGASGSAKPNATPGRRRKKNRAWLIAGIAGGAAVLVALAVTLLADPFSAPAQPAAHDGGLALPPRPGTPSAVDRTPEPPSTPPATQGKPEVPALPALQPEPIPPAPANPPTSASGGTVAPTGAAGADAPRPVEPPPPSRPTRQPPREPRPTAVAKGVVEVATVVGRMAVPPASSGLGLLVLNASPWGTASVDGRALGETPLELKLGAGRYRIRVVHPTLGEKETQIMVKPGQRTRFLADFDGR